MKTKRLPRILFVAAAAFAFVACVGPTTLVSALASNARSGGSPVPDKDKSYLLSVVESANKRFAAAAEDYNVDAMFFSLEGRELRFTMRIKEKDLPDDERRKTEFLARTMEENPGLVFEIWGKAANAEDTVLTGRFFERLVANWVSASVVFETKGGRNVARASVSLSDYKKFVEEWKRPPVSEGTMTDSRDGRTYRTVKVGSRNWMAENLAFETAESRCYGDDPEKCREYGRLYDYDDALKSCPEGWHLATRPEFDELTGTLKFDAARVVSVLPGGCQTARDSAYQAVRDTFADGGEMAHFWYFDAFDDLSTGYGGEMRFSRHGYGGNNARLKAGLSVRCVEGERKIVDPASVEEGTVRDARDGRVYRTVKIGDRTWTAENMAFETPGDSCDSDEARCSALGRRYAFGAAQSVCPAGWRLPSLEEFHELFGSMNERGMDETDFFETQARYKISFFPDSGKWKDNELRFWSSTTLEWMPGDERRAVLTCRDWENGVVTARHPNHRKGDMSAVCERNHLRKDSGHKMSVRCVKEPD